MWCEAIMGEPRATFFFSIHNEDLLLLAENLLRHLSIHFLQAKSVEIHGHHGLESEKLPGSVDGDLFWGRHSLPQRLAGEVMIEGTDFTTLNKPDEGLTIPGDIPRIVERLQFFSDHINRVWKTNQDIRPSVFWTFWGLCKLEENFEGTMPKCGWFLRERLRVTNVWNPIVRVTCDLIQQPKPYFIFSLIIRSFAWSRYTSDLDRATGKWGTKPDSKLEFKNAWLLAETISGFVRQYPEAEFEWEMEQEHTPDLTGFLPSEIEARLGPPKRIWTG